MEYIHKKKHTFTILLMQTLSHTNTSVQANPFKQCVPSEC